MRTSMKDWSQLERSSKRQVLGLLCVSALAVGFIYTGSSIGTCPAPSGANSAEGSDAIAKYIPLAVTPLAPVTQPPSYALLDRITERTDGLKSSPDQFRKDLVSIISKDCSQGGIIPIGEGILQMEEPSVHYEVICATSPHSQAK